MKTVERAELLDAVPHRIVGFRELPGCRLGRLLVHVELTGKAHRCLAAVAGDLLGRPAPAA
jgi:hypothetical protein